MAIFFPLGSVIAYKWFDEVVILTVLSISHTQIVHFSHF